MNRGLMLKAAREALSITVICAGLLFLMEVFLAYALPEFEEQLAGGLMQIAFLERIISAILGTEVGTQLSGEAFASIVWVHPTILALVWAHALIHCTRMLAGEIDRGTADLLLTLPVSRWELLVSETVVWVASGAVVLMSVFAGNVIGILVVSGPGDLSYGVRGITLVNLAALYLAVGGMAWFISSMSDRRGVALTTLFSLLVVSLLVNYLAQFWRPAERVSFLSILNYYRPMDIFQQASWPLGDIAVLLAVGVTFWIAAGKVLTRRNIHTT